MGIFHIQTNAGWWSCHNFRGLMITSVLGKSIRSAFREKLLPCYRGYAGDSYYSARQFGHVGQAAMALRLFAKSGQDVGCSVGMFFLDIKSAYYKVCHELAVGFEGMDHEIILNHFDMPVSAVEDLHLFFYNAWEEPWMMRNVIPFTVTSWLNLVMVLGCGRQSVRHSDAWRFEARWWPRGHVVWIHLRTSAQATQAWPDCFSSLGWTWLERWAPTTESLWPSHPMQPIA